MPIYASTYNGLNIQPNIIPPSIGDLEEARIRRQMDLAKLRELTLAPGFEQQRINLTQQGQTNEQQYRTGVLGETSMHNVMEEKHWAQMLGLDQQKLSETAREHNSALSELSDYHQGVLKNQLTEGFMAHLAPLYGADVTAKVLQNRSLPELTGALDLIHKNESEKLANTTMAQIQAGQQKGIDMSPIVENLKTTNPDAYGLIKNKLPATATGPVVSTGTKLGQTARSLSENAPLLALGGGLGLSAMLGLAIAKKSKPIPSKSFQDFIDALKQ